MPFDIVDIIGRASIVEHQNIPVTKRNLVFLAMSGAIEASRRLNALITPLEDGGAPDTQYIRLKKHYGLSVQEDTGMRNDRFLSPARKLELTAAIGRELRIEESEAIEILVNQERWEILSEELRSDLLLWFTCYMAETNDATLEARQVTTIIQNRLDREWRLEWTMQLPAEVQKHFLDFIEGENKGWPKPELPLLSSSDDVTAIDVAVEAGETGSPATNGKRTKSAAVV